MTLITSSDNPRFRELVGLAESGRDRRPAGLALIDGFHLIDSYRQRIGAPHQLVVRSSGFHRPEVAAMLASLTDVPLLELSDALFRRLSTVQSPTDIVALIRIPERRLAPENPTVIGRILGHLASRALPAGSRPSSRGPPQGEPPQGELKFP